MKNNQNSKHPIQFDEDEELLDIRNDSIFKAVFTKDTPASKGALSGLVSALIERKVIIQTIMANEPPVNNLLDRCIRFDIACRAESGELINIEMSLNPEFYEPYLTNRGIRMKINEILNMETLIQINGDEIEFARLTTELKNRLDWKSGIISAERRGRVEGRIEGMNEGFVKGREEVARNLLIEGAKPDFIQKVTGLDLAAFQKLIEKP